MYFDDNNPNVYQFKKDICQSIAIYRRILKENKPRNISKLLHTLGFNYVHHAEFLKGFCWYVMQLDEDPNELLNLIKYFKEIIYFFPKNQFMYVIFKKMYNYLNEMHFYAYSTDFINISNIMSRHLDKIGNIFSEEQWKELKLMNAKLQNKKYEYFIHDLVENLSDRMLYSINISQISVFDQKTPEEIQIVCLLILIYYFKNNNLDFLKEKYVKMFEEKFANYTHLLEKI